MIGNVSVLLALAEAIASFLPTVGPAAARRSRAIVRRTSNCRTALNGTVMARLDRSLPGRRRGDVAGANAALAGEALSP